MLATIINYCTNDSRFIDKCIAEAAQFSSQIIIPVCDHFFDGAPENRILLDATYAKHPDCQFIEFAYLPDRLYSPYHSLSPADDDWPSFWAATARHIGTYFLKPEITAIFFLDADEIVEAEAFLEWMPTASSFAAQRLAAYLYILKPTLRAKKIVNLPLLVQREAFTPLALLNPLERIGAYQAQVGQKRECAVGLHGKPFVHHYSWVRTKEECLQKAKTWSHRSEQDWPKLIERAFAGDLNAPFDIPLEFEEIESPYFDPFAISFPRNNSLPLSFPHVKKVTPRDIFQMELEHLL